MLYRYRYVCWIRFGSVRLISHYANCQQRINCDALAANVENGHTHLTIDNEPHLIALVTYGESIVRLQTAESGPD